MSLKKETKDVLLIALTDKEARDDLVTIIEAGGSGSGSQILTGSGVPSDASGSDGDFYVDTATGDYYTKTSGTWTYQASLRGPAGTNGTNGTNGTAGAAGPNYTYGRTIFVDTLNGSDVTTTGAVGAPTKTIARAIALLPAYATLMRTIRIVAPGTYSETLTLSQAGVVFAADRGVTLAGTIAITPAANQALPVTFEGFQAISSIITFNSNNTAGTKQIQFNNCGLITQINVAPAGTLTATNSIFGSVIYTGVTGTSPTFVNCVITSIDQTATTNGIASFLRNSVLTNNAGKAAIINSNSAVLNAVAGTSFSVASRPISPVSGDVTILPYEQVVLYDAGTATGIITLPLFSSFARGFLYIKRIDTLGDIITIAAQASEGIEQEPSIELGAGCGVLLMADAETSTQWLRMAEFKPVLAPSFIRFPSMNTATRDGLAATGGEAILNTDTGKLNYYDGAVWQEVATV